MIMDEKLNRSYEDAKKHVKEVREFYEHLMAYCAVNIGLFAINMIVSPGQLWFFWATIGWGIGVICHGATVFGINRYLNRDWEERKIAEYMDEKR